MKGNPEGIQPFPVVPKIISILPGTIHKSAELILVLGKQYYNGLMICHKRVAKGWEDLEEDEVYGPPIHSAEIRVFFRKFRQNSENLATSNLH